MDLKKIYDESLDLYPENISIADGIPDNNNGFISNNLVAAYEHANEEASKKGEWHELMVWIFYQILHENAKSYFANAIMDLSRSIDTKLFATLITENLETEGYEDMLEEYQQSDFSRQ